MKRRKNPQITQVMQISRGGEHFLLTCRRARSLLKAGLTITAHLQDFEHEKLKTGRGGVI
ncbi:MAG: hypothetical protein JO025_28735 [Verrucomicrobia bacterium]|nr:hypothetical protein [Verrucomicrobiota bacterium]